MPGAMPSLSFNGATNTFIPVDHFETGIDQFERRAGNITQGILKLPSNSGTTTYPDHQVRKYIQSWNVTVRA